jgi:hypothetical protein
MIGRRIRDQPVQNEPQAVDMFDMYAFRDLARSRLNGIARRMGFYAVNAAIGAAFIPIPWMVLCLGLITAAEFIENRAARTLVAVQSPKTGIIDPPVTENFVVAHIAVAITVSFGLAALWAFTGPDA